MERHPVTNGPLPANRYPRAAVRARTPAIARSSKAVARNKTSSCANSTRQARTPSSRGIRYFRIVESYRKNGKPAIGVLAHLGRVDDILQLHQNQHTVTLA